ncbi:hypothetical protein WG66_010245 [Moniliophthora roreri]|nr:hypothetical protein WG66_010245 [Moniliophthora roreri]
MASDEYSSHINTDKVSGNVANSLFCIRYLRSAAVAVHELRWRYTNSERFEQAGVERFDLPAKFGSGVTSVSANTIFTSVFPLPALVEGEGYYDVFPRNLQATS